MLLNLLLVRFSFNYLGDYEYGVWITISSVIVWMNLADFGLGNGLKNKLTEALAEEDFILAKKYISTTYALLFCISLFLLVVFVVLQFFLDWNFLFNIKKELSSPIDLVVATIFFGVLLKFFFGIISTILLATQNTALSDFLYFLILLLTTVMFFVHIKEQEASILNLSFVFVFTPIFIFILASWIFYNFKFKSIRPTFNDIDFSLSSNILTLGYKFFFIQIAVIILFSTDNFILAHLFSPKEVSSYNIAFRYYNLVTIGFSVITTPFWTGITDAFKLGDSKWIRISVLKLIKLWFLLIPLIICMILLSEKIYPIWIGKDIYISSLLNITFGLYVLIVSWNSILAVIVNGMGKVKIQYMLAVFSAIVNIPLSIILVKYTSYGVVGIAWATILCLLVSSLIISYQCYLIINKTAKGIWFK